MIVTSILLAFGIQAWWEGAGKRDQERRYLQSLRGEFLEAQSMVQANERDRTLAVHAHEALLDQTQGASPAPPDSLLFWISLTSFPINFTPPRAVYDDLVSSGSTQLIRSDPLRVALARYGTRLESLQAFDADAWATWEQRLQPFLEGRIPRVDRILHGLFSQRYDVPFVASGSTADLVGLLAEPRFQDMVAERWLRLFTARVRFADVSDELNGTIALIDAELDEVQ